MVIWICQQKSGNEVLSVLTPANGKVTWRATQLVHRVDLLEREVEQLDRVSQLHTNWQRIQLIANRARIQIDLIQRVR